MAGHSTYCGMFRSFQIFTHINNIVWSALMPIYLSAFCLNSLGESLRGRINGSMILGVFGAPDNAHSPSLTFAVFS